MIANKQWNKGRKISKKDVLFENRELIMLYDKAKETGDYSKVKETLVDKLKYLVAQRIKVNRFDKCAEMEDLMQQGIMEVVNFAEEYDPRQSMPSSYFEIIIDAALKKCVRNDSHMTQHYLNKAILLDKVARKYGYESASDPRLTNEKLAQLSGESLVTITRTMEQKGMKFESLGESWTDRSYKSEGFEDPALIVRNADENDRLHKIINATLSDYQLFLIKAVYAEDNRMSYTEISEMLKDENLQKRLGLRSPKSPSDIGGEIQKALRKIRHDMEFKKQFGYRERTGFREYTVVEQAPMEYIVDMILPPGTEHMPVTT